MKKENKIFIISISVLLFMAVIAGIATRKSYLNNLDLDINMQQATSLSFCDNEDYVKIYFDNSIDELSKLKESSDLIVKVRTTDHRQMMSQTILSNVEILDVYKGSHLKKGDNIYIYEPNYFINNSYIVMYGYNLMVNNNEYIFFLKNLKVPEGYKYKGNEKISYMPVSTIYGKYTWKGTSKTKVVNTQEMNQNLSFNSIKDMDIIIEDVKVLEKYKKLKDEVLKIAH